MDKMDMDMVHISETRGRYSATKHYNFTKQLDSESLSVISGANSQSLPSPYSVDIFKSTRTGKEDGGKTGAKNDDSIFLRPFRWLRGILLDIFMPFQYPDSVSDDYLAYQIWDTIQGFFGSVCNVFAARAVYEALGVGDAKSTALAATTIVMLEDASGWIGEILFGWVFARAFDYNSKKWRFFADVGYDLAVGFKLSYPVYAAQYLLPIFCATAFFKSFQFIAGEASRASLIGHQARANNIGNVKAKDRAQEKLVNLLGLGVSLVALHLLDGQYVVIYTIFGACVLLHLTCNYMALKTIRFATFNEARLLLCLREFLKRGRLPDLKRVNKAESVLLGFGIQDKDVCGGGFRIKAGVSLRHAFGIKSGNVDMDIEGTLRYFEGKHFLVVVHWKKPKRVVHIVLHEDVKPVEIIEAYVRSVFVTHLFTRQKQKGNSKDGNDGLVTGIGIMDPEVSHKWNQFRTLAEQADYNLAVDELAAKNWRAKW